MARGDDIDRWMVETAEGRAHRQRLVFNKETKQLELVSTDDPSADDSIEFTAEEATRFA